MPETPGILPDDGKERASLGDKASGRIEERLGNQILWMRGLSFILALVIIALLVCIERRIYENLESNLENQFLTLLAVTPIVAVTAITIAVLSGVFKGGQSTENLSGILRRLIGNQE